LPCKCPCIDARQNLRSLTLQCRRLKPLLDAYRVGQVVARQRG
jgi:hypothetical protein